MSIVGVFTQSRPEIGGIYFDAILEESTELQTEVTEFPIEDGSLGNDHAVMRPLRITMTVGISDNAFRAVAAQMGGGLAGAAVGSVVGKVMGKMSGRLASAIGLLGDVANAGFSAGRAATRSQSALDEIRELQASQVLLTIVSAKGGSYQNCLITNTRQTTSKENEQGLELIVELQQMLIINSTVERREVLPPDDSATTQAQREVDLGEVTPT